MDELSLLISHFQLKHSASITNETLVTETRPSGKVSASQRLSNLRDRLNTVDLIPLQLPAANSDRLVCTQIFLVL